jgi:2',3'-cyclic-nucleotide 2'-phosphodiesterase
MKILLVGDIVGAPGRTGFANILTRLKLSHRIDFVVANAENDAGGKGITRKITEELMEAGANVLTMGDHVWDQKEAISFIGLEPRLLRPANLVPGCPGAGWITVATDFGRITVISLVGRVFMHCTECPFRTIDAILTREKNLGKVIIVDIHAEATSEKVAMGRYVDGRVSVVAGTHTHVQTADEMILPKGTAYITDLGMTGPKDSVIGRELQSVLSMFLTGMPAKFELATEGVALDGALVDVDEETGRARSIKRIRETLVNDPGGKA